MMILSLKNRLDLRKFTGNFTCRLWEMKPWNGVGVLNVKSWKFIILFEVCFTVWPHFKWTILNVGVPVLWSTQVVCERCDPPVAVWRVLLGCRYPVLTLMCETSGPDESLGLACLVAQHQLFRNYRTRKVLVSLRMCTYDDARAWSGLKIKFYNEISLKRPFGGYPPPARATSPAVDSNPWDYPKHWSGVGSRVPKWCDLPVQELTGV